MAYVISTMVKCDSQSDQLTELHKHRDVEHMLMLFLFVRKYTRTIINSYTTFIKTDDQHSAVESWTHRCADTLIDDADMFVYIKLWENSNLID